MTRTRLAAATPAPLLALLAVSFLALPSSAQSGRFGEEISITEIEIPVQVLRRGEPVRGLSADDFEVYDDGVRRDVEGFRVIDLSVRAGSGASGPAAGAGAAEPATEGRRILLLFDLLFSRRHHLERSLLGAEEMVAGQLHPSDRVAVAYLTGGGANLLLGFSRDRGEIGTALETLHAILDMRPAEARAGMVRLARARGGAATGGSGGTGDEPRRTAVGELNERFGAAAAVAMLGGAHPETDAVFGNTFGSGEWPLAGGYGDGEIQVDPVAQNTAPTNPFAIGASLAAAGEVSAVRTLTIELGRLATLLRDVPGQKHMLYFSEGFGRVLHNPEARALGLRYMENLFEALRRGGWTLHAVDVGGIPDPFTEQGFNEDSLHFLAAETGGQLYENYNRIYQATAKLVERTSVTYVLTIRPGDLPAGGSLHRIEVRLAEARPGTRVLHRTGYYAPKPAASRSLLERQLDTVEMVLGDRELDEIGTRVLAGALPAQDGLVPVPVVVEVPSRHFAGERRVDLQVQIYAVDEHGGVQDLWLRRLQLDPQQVAGALSRGGLRVLGAVAVPPGDYRLRVLVQDAIDGRRSLSTRPLLVAAGDPELLPFDPVIVDRSGDWLELVSLPKGPGAQAGRVLTLGSAPVVPQVSPVVRSWQEVELLLVVADAAPVELQGRLLDAEGRQLDARVRFVERLPDDGDGYSRYLGRVATADLDPGRYHLEVRAAGGAARQVAFDVVE
jgi:VWFA-related protein